MGDAVNGGLADIVATEINSLRGAVIIEGLVSNGVPSILVERANLSWFIDVQAPDGGPGWIEVVEADDDGPLEKPKKKPRRDLLSPGGVAQLLTERLGRRVDAAQVRQSIVQGRLPAHRLVGPEGKVTGYGIAEADALAWQGPLKRGGRR